jgi:hypothetical protein
VRWARCTYLVFLHPVGSTGLIMHLMCPRHETSTHYFHGRVGWIGFYKKRARTRYTELVFLHPVGSVGHVVYSSASGACNIHALLFMLGWESAVCRKRAPDMLCQTCVFVSGGICGSCSALWCVCGAKCRHTIFQAWVGPVGN